MSRKTGTKSDEYKNVFGNGPKTTTGNTGTADWGSVTPEVISSLVGMVTSRGGAVRFGYTRDGGAYALGLYYGNDSKTYYCRPNEDVIEFLRTWEEFYQTFPYSGGISPAAE